MTRDEIVTALRCCGNGDVNECKPCPLRANAECHIKLTHAAADLIENQQNHIAALMKANDSLKDAIARRDKQIEDMKKKGEVMAREQAAMGERIAMREEEKWTKTY